jgi:hypothetical protein
MLVTRRNLDTLRDADRQHRRKTFRRAAVAELPGDVVSPAFHGTVGKSCASVTIPKRQVRCRWFHTFARFAISFANKVGAIGIRLASRAREILTDSNLGVSAII